MKTIFKNFRYRKILLAIADAFIVAASALISERILVVFFENTFRDRMPWVSIAISVITCFCGLALSNAYNKLWRYFNLKDYLSCIYGIVFGIGTAAAFMSLVYPLPPVYVLLHGLIAVFGICLFRFIFKNTFIDLVESGRSEAKFKRTMIIGGGHTCELLLNELKIAKSNANPENRNGALFEPVCIIDDDKAKLGKSVGDVQIVGTTADIRKYVEKMKIELIVFCIPSCPEDERQRILDTCSATNLPVKLIPNLGNVLFDNAHPTLLGQVRDIKVEDLLGRDPIVLDTANIRQFLSGKVCMVTGGGGSIGSELVRQIAAYAPKQIVIVDICENYAYDIQQELVMEYGSALDLAVQIASVRDYDRMDQLFRSYHPDIVFHAAAHKHVPLMEASPMEAIKNNVIGTFNTASLAKLHHVKKFVMISTDKAVNPTNVMGASKRCCEMVVQYIAKQPDCKTEFVTTRFGNVLGSNGSVIPIFKKQIELGKPVTVTHPDIIRYFMTIPEAVSLVMEAAAIAQGGEIFILDMGKPVKIVTLAENLIRMYGKIPYEDVQIVFTGLRPGEKIEEELLMNEEGLKKTQNKRIFIGTQIGIDETQFAQDLETLRLAAAENDADAAVRALRRIVPTFTTPEAYNRTHTHPEKA